MIDYSKIVVLYRRDDSLELFGIPYDMRPGQSPRHIWEGARRYYDGLAGMRTRATREAPNRDFTADWISLGVPGRETTETLAWLATLEDVPQGPHEWCRVVHKIVTCGRCGATVRRSWDHLDLGEHGERWACDARHGGES